MVELSANGCAGISGGQASSTPPQGLGVEHQGAATLLPPRPVEPPPLPPPPQPPDGQRGGQARAARWVTWSHPWASACCCYVGLVMSTLHLFIYC